MPARLPQRVPQNAPGDFYVQANRCTRCCMPHHEAPDLMNDPDAPFEECYFRRQPQTPDEVVQAMNAICVSEVCALRYGGRDPEIIRQVGPGQSDYSLDETPLAEAASEERK